jgi:hypothetical protein
MRVTWLNMELGNLQFGIKVKVSTLDLHSIGYGSYKVWI